RAEARPHDRHLGVIATLRLLANAKRPLERALGFSKAPLQRQHLADVVERMSEVAVRGTERTLEDREATPVVLECLTQLSLLVQLEPDVVEASCHLDMLGAQRALLDLERAAVALKRL